MARATAKLAELLSVPDDARHASKMLGRGPMTESLFAAREADIATFSTFCFSPVVQASLGKYMEALKKRAK